MMRMPIWLATLLLIPGLALADFPRLSVSGLFSGQAVVTIEGRQVILKQGQTDASGIKLISATSQEAVFEYQGEQQTLGVGGRAIASSYRQPEKQTVSIGLNNAAQYVSSGSINGRPVQFLVDTGANIVAISGADARNLGIDYRLHGAPTRVTTASGVAESYQVQLDSVKLGAIEVRNVLAQVIEGNFPEIPLLGMTFLGQLDFREERNVLYVTKPY